VGTHGLIIAFRDPHSGAQRSATYLPEIAAREGWSRRAAVESLVRKSGYGGPITERLLGGLAVTRYQSSAMTRRYEEYAEATRRNAAAARAKAAGARAEPPVAANGH
jgi:AMMECR1 domain-containing protein